MACSMWAKVAQEKYFSRLASYSWDNSGPTTDQVHHTRASNSDVLNTHVLPPPARWYFWQSSISTVQLTSACHLCGLSCLKNPGVSRGQPVVGGPFSYKQMMEPLCLEDTSCGLVSAAFWGDRNVSPLPCWLLWLSHSWDWCFSIPLSETPEEPLGHQDVWF